MIKTVAQNCTSYMYPAINEINVLLVNLSFTKGYYRAVIYMKPSDILRIYKLYT